MMNERIRRILTVAATAFAALGLAACTGTATPAPTSTNDTDSGYVSGDGSVQQWSPEEREEPVELAGESMTGDPLDLEDWRGSVVVVNFWYAECPPCRKEAPDLVALAKEFEGEVQFMGVNHINEPETALAFERRFELPYPSLHDKDAAGVASMQNVVPLQAMPSTVVLDTEGRVAARILGLAEKATLKALITDTLAES